MKSGIVVYRGDGGGFIGVKYISELNNLKIGDVIENRGFLSTSVDRGGLSYGHIHYEIKLPKGFNQGQFIKKYRNMNMKMNFL